MSKKQHAYFEKNGFGDADIDENEIDYDELDAAMDTFLLRLNPKDIMDTMNHIKTKYGSFNAYFDSIGFYENDRQRLKTALSVYNSSSLWVVAVLYIIYYYIKIYEGITYIRYSVQ